MFNNICDPTTNKWHNLKSLHGNRILNKYLYLYSQKGGYTLEESLANLCRATPNVSITDSGLSNPNVSITDSDLVIHKSIDNIEDIKKDLHDYGYTIIKNAVDSTDIDSFRREVLQYLKDLPRIPGKEIQLDNLTDSLEKTEVKKLYEIWPLHKTFGAPTELDIFHLTIFWKIRQDPRLYNLYRQLLHTDKLLTTIDRASIKLPGMGETEFIHIDRDIHNWTDDPPLQSMIFFSDSYFNAIPKSHTKDFHNNIINTYEIPPKKSRSMTMIDKKKDPKLLKLNQQLRKIPVPTGSLIIWSENLWHASVPNPSNNIRLTLYIGYHKLDTHPWKPNTKEERLESFKSGRRPPRFPSGSKTSLVPLRYYNYTKLMKTYLDIVPEQFHGTHTVKSTGKILPWLDEQKYDPTSIRGYQPYSLSELGEKLLGSKEW